MYLLNSFLTCPVEGVQVESKLHLHNNLGQVHWPHKACVCICNMCGLQYFPPFTKIIWNLANKPNWWVGRESRKSHNFAFTGLFYILQGKDKFEGASWVSRTFSFPYLTQQSTNLNINRNDIWTEFNILLGASSLSVQSKILNCVNFIAFVAQIYFTMWDDTWEMFHLVSVTWRWMAL